jgi:hypothetical protein
MTSAKANLPPTRLSPDGVLTPPGMAHWAGTGPRGTTCRECRHWMTTGKWQMEAGPAGGGDPLPSRCRRYRSLGMHRRFGPPLPHDTPSCQHFDPSEKPQPLARPKRIEADWLT